MDDRALHPAPEGAAGHPSALGDYQLSPRFARRAAADVYEATHLPTGGARRVYVLRPGAMQNNSLVHRVVCEADAARWIRQPAAAKLEAHGDTPSRRLFVAVEHSGGRPFGDVIAEAGRLAPWRVVRLAGRLVEALDEAHLLGLVHGRLTPAAAVVAPDADGADASGAPAVTLVGLGTAAIDGADPVEAAERPFVSPEQLAGSEADPRSDVFGLASLLEYALTGAVPGAPATDETALAADVAAVHRVLAAARAADPRRRPATVKAFWENLLEALVADAVRATGDTRAAVASPAAPLDERAALAHLELADFAIDLPPAAESAPAAAVEAAPPVLEFRGIDVSAPRTPPPAPRRPLQPRWAEERTSYTPAPYVPPERYAPAAFGGAGPHAVAAGSARRRGVRSVLMNAWWLAAVPAVAAALAWPTSRPATPVADAAVAAPAEPTAVSAAWRRITAPPVLETVTAHAEPTPSGPSAAPAARQSAAGTLAHRDADRSGVADEGRPASPATPRFEMPQIYIVDAPAPSAGASAKVLVRPEEFSTRIKVPGAPQ